MIKYKKALFWTLALLGLFLAFNSFSTNKSTVEWSAKKPTRDSEGAKKWPAYHKELEVIKQLPVIMVSGLPRSGTTLMRSLFDVHDELSCGREVQTNFCISNRPIDNIINIIYL